MAKKRYINTKFWDDSYVVNLDPIEKLMFLYFITNPLTDICGIYEIPLKRIAFDTGIDKDMVLKILERFEYDKKIYYINGWIYVKNFSKNQAINDSVQKGIERSISVVPIEILDKINIIEQSVDRVSTDCDIPKLKPKPILKPKLRPEPKPKDSKQSLPVNEIMKEFYEINPTRNFGNVNQRKAVEELLKKYGQEQLKAMILQYRSVISEKFCPVATTPIAFKNKLGDIIAYFNKKQNDTIGGRVI